MNATMHTFVWGTVPLRLDPLVDGLGALMGVPATIACGALVSCVAAL
jgi:hypothetical protein